MGKENKTIIHEFDPVIYPRKLWISITRDNKFVDFNEIPVMDESSDADVFHAFNNKTNKGGLFIRFEALEAMSTSNIAHESCHAAMEIIEYIRGEVDFKNQEYLCYLTGWIAKCCEEVKMYHSKNKKYGKSKD